MRYFYFLGFFFLKISISFSQELQYEWAISFGSLHYENAYDIAVDNYGNVYTTGYFTGSVDFDPSENEHLLYSNGYSIFILKLDAEGNFIWVKSFLGPPYCSGTSLKIDSNGDIYFSGIFKNYISFDTEDGLVNFYTPNGLTNGVLGKLNKSGVVQWVKQIEGNGYNSISAITLGNGLDPNIYLCGYFRNTVDLNPNEEEFSMTSTSEVNNAFLAKWSKEGEFIWAKQMKGSGNKLLRGIAYSDFGQITAIGYFENDVLFDEDTEYNLISYGETDGFMVQYDIYGNVLWSKGFGGTMFDQVQEISIDKTSNEIICVGHFQNTAYFNESDNEFSITSAGDYDSFVAKYTIEGDLIWLKRFGGSGIEKPYGLTVDAEGNLFITGYFTGNCDFNPNEQDSFNLYSNGNYDIFINCFDTMGNFKIAHKIGGNSVEYGLALASDTSSHVYLSATFYSATVDVGTFQLQNQFSGSYTGDVLITKINPEHLGALDYSNRNQIIIYPNPFSNYLKIDTDKEIEVSIYNSIGELLYNFKDSDSQLLDKELAAFPKGIYFVKVKNSSQDEMVKTIKLIKN